VLRVPGFLNKKYDQDFLVDARSQTDRVYDLHDFKLRTDPGDSDHRRPRRSPSKAEVRERRPVSQSEKDWAYVKRSLASGADPDELIYQLAYSRATDKSDPHYYARLTVKKALADLRTEPTSTSNAPAPGQNGREVGR